MTQPIRIILADDHRLLRTGLKLLLSSKQEFIVVAEASNGKETLSILETTPADVVLLDLSMPVMNGLDCLKEIRRRRYAVKVLVLTMYSEQQYVKAVMQHGAAGYLCKDSLDAELFAALRTIMQGGRYLGERETKALLASVIDEPTEPSSLSTREQEVLQYLVRGHSLSTIADKLHLSIKTVSTYKTRLMQKLECTTKAELVDYAIQHHLLK